MLSEELLEPQLQLYSSASLHIRGSHPLISLMRNPKFVLYFVNIQILTSLHLIIHLPHLLDSKCFNKSAMPTSALDAERKLLWRSSVNESQVDNGQHADTEVKRLCLVLCLLL